MKFILFCLLACAAASLLALDPPADPLSVFESNAKYSLPKEIEDIFQEAEQNPQALQKLREYPAAYSFRRLRDLGNPGNVLRNDQDGERQRIARELLRTHPGMEEFLAGALTRMNQELVKQYDPNADPFSPNRKAASGAGRYLQALEAACDLPGNAAFRLVGPFLSTAYFPEQHLGDANWSSPADQAKGYLNSLRKEWLNEPPLDTIEDARKWWKENAYRFAAGEPRAVPTTPASSTPEPAADATTPKPVKSATSDVTHRVANDSGNSFVGIGVVAVLAVILLVGIKVWRERKR